MTEEEKKVVNEDALTDEKVVHEETLTDEKDVHEETLTDEKVVESEKQEEKLPNNDSVKELLNKLQLFYQTHKKKVISLATIIVLAIVSLFIFNYLDSQPKSIVNEVKVEFSGYDESGKLSYNSDDIAELVAELAYRKAGFNKSDAKALAQHDPVVYSTVSLDKKSSFKLVTAENLIKSVRFEFDVLSGLKNGEEVTFLVTTTSKHAPVKAEKKKFKVQNLKEYEKVSAEDLLKETNVSFIGFNGYGTISIDDKKNNQNYFQVSNKEKLFNLKNGDKVILYVNDNYANSLKSSGKKIDNNTVELTVSGLKEIKDIKNFGDLSKKNDDYVKSEYKNDEYSSYTIEPQGNYMKIKNSNSISFVTIYKITTNGSGNSKTVTYKYYGYSVFLLSNGSLDLDTATKITGFGTKDLEGLKAQLSTEGFKAYQEQKD